jgi:hypothetical protein
MQAPSWRSVPISEFAARLSASLPLGRRPAVLAVDGHGSSGKSSLASRLARHVPHSAVLHTDDVAWNHSVLAWDDLFRDGILAPLRTGAAVRYRPPDWERLGRPGAIELDACEVLIVEGVGASRLALADDVDLSLWVETPEPIRLARDDLRLPHEEITPEGYVSWLAEEHDHFLRDRPWLRARWWVDGCPPQDVDSEAFVVVADPPAQLLGLADRAATTASGWRGRRTRPRAR